MSKKLSRVCALDVDNNCYRPPAILIAQIGKNFTYKHESIISGKELLQIAMEIILDIQYQAAYFYDYRLKIFDLISAYCKRLSPIARGLLPEKSERVGSFFLLALTIYLNIYSKNFQNQHPLKNNLKSFVNRHEQNSHKHLFHLNVQKWILYHFQFLE